MKLKTKWNNTPAMVVAADPMPCDARATSRGKNVSAMANTEIEAVQLNVQITKYGFILSHYFCILSIL
jgi:hypothetical protein